MAFIRLRQKIKIKSKIKVAKKYNNKDGNNPIYEKL